jgi:tripartite-type tricarboxylate transporter receptor subunit TctC
MTRTGRITRRGALALAALPGLGAQALAQEASPGAAQAWPDRPLRIIVPFPPGGPVDTGARLIAAALGPALGGQTVLVENRSGAGGVIGIDAVAKAAPDGLTIGYGSTGAVAVNATLLPNLPYDTLRDLRPLGVATSTPSALVVRPEGPRSLAALLEQARARPGQLSYASTGPGGTPHLAAELLRLRTGGPDITHVAYRGAAPVITALLAGEVTMAFLDVPVLLPHIREGKLRALCVTAEARSAVLPEVPTTAEAGAPGVIVEGWNAMLVPAATPPERVARLAAALDQVLAPGSETRGRFEAIGQRVVNLGPDAAAAFIRAEIARWGEVVRAAKITPD